LLDNIFVAKYVFLNIVGCNCKHLMVTCTISAYTKCTYLNSPISTPIDR